MHAYIACVNCCITCVLTLHEEPVFATLQLSLRLTLWSAACSCAATLLCITRNCRHHCCHWPIAVITLTLPDCCGCRGMLIVKMRPGTYRTSLHCCNNMTRAPWIGLTWQHRFTCSNPHGAFSATALYSTLWPGDRVAVCRYACQLSDRDTLPKPCHACSFLPALHSTSSWMVCSSIKVRSKGDKVAGSEL